ncbi:hypothetical protein ACFOZ6_28880 [Actinoplanes siamensis]
MTRLNAARKALLIGIRFSTACNFMNDTSFHRPKISPVKTAGFA